MDRAPYADVGVVHTSPSATASAGDSADDACASTHDTTRRLSCAADLAAPYTAAHATSRAAFVERTDTAADAVASARNAKCCVSDATSRSLESSLDMRRPQYSRRGVVVVLLVVSMRRFVGADVNRRETYVVVGAETTRSLDRDSIFSARRRGGRMSNPPSATSRIRWSRATRPSGASCASRAHDARADVHDDARRARMSTGAHAAGTRAGRHPRTTPSAR